MDYSATWRTNRAAEIGGALRVAGETSIGDSLLDISIVLKAGSAKKAQMVFSQDGEIEFIQAQLGDGTFIEQNFAEGEFQRNVRLVHPDGTYQLGLQWDTPLASITGNYEWWDGGTKYYKVGSKPTGPTDGNVWVGGGVSGVDLSGEGGAAMVGVAGGGEVQDALAGVAVGLIGDGATDNLAAINALLAAHDRVDIYPSATGSVFGFSDTITIPGGKLLWVHPAVTIKLLLASTATAVLTAGGAGARVECEGVIDGNLTAREANGFTGHVFGFKLLNVADCIFTAAVYKDMGATAASMATYGENGGGVVIQLTAAATADVSNNRVGPGHLVDCQNHGFMARIVSDFLGVDEIDSDYYCQFNSISGLVGNGGNKNAVEMAGPNTRYNEVTDIRAINCTGQSGLECDFGAYGNAFRRCSVEYESGVQIVRTFSAFNDASNIDVTPGAPQKLSRDNLFEDCAFLGGTMSGAFSVRGFCVLQRGQGTRFVRPRMTGQVRGSGTGQLVGLYIEALTGFTDDITCIDPDFSGVEYGSRALGPVHGVGTIRIVGEAGRIRYSYRLCDNSTTPVKALRVKVRAEGATTAIVGRNEELIDTSGCEFVGQTETTLTQPENPDGVLFHGDNHYRCATATGVPIAVVVGGGAVIDRGGSTYTSRVPGTALNGGNGRITNSGQNHVTSMALMSPVISRANPVRASDPITGNYTIGDKIILPTPLAGAAWQKVCTASGTPDAISVTATSIHLEPTVTVTDATGLKKGQYVQLPGAFTLARILSIAGTTLTMSVNASGSVTDTMTNRAPTFKYEASLEA